MGLSLACFDAILMVQTIPFELTTTLFLYFKIVVFGLHCNYVSQNVPYFSKGLMLGLLAGLKRNKNSTFVKGNIRNGNHSSVI